MVKRIITGLICIPLFAWCVLFSSEHVFAVVTGIFVLLAGWEFGNLIGFKGALAKIIYVLVVLACIAGSFFIYLPGLFLGVGMWWLLAFFAVYFYPRGKTIWGDNAFLKCLMGIITLVPTWIGVNLIRLNPAGVYELLFLFVLIWGVDSGAYFAGKAFGKRKLLPEVSPGKTIEGAIGAYITMLIVLIIAAYYFKFNATDAKIAFYLGNATLFASIVGDLFESMLKRNAKIKDSGSFFPGHGGILDRIDSLTAAAPVYVLTLMLLGKM